MPGSVEIRGRIERLAKASTSDSRTWLDFSARNMIGKSAGLTLRKLGGVGSSTGRRRIAEEMADCTSSAAPSMLRLRSNWSTIEVLPSEEVEVIDVTPAMVENWRSRIEATEAAIVSGLAPGSCAWTWMVGKSTRGTAATGSCLKPKMPAMTIIAISRIVITGRRMQRAESDMSALRWG